MTNRSTDDDVATFEKLRPDLVALAYRMLGDVARAEDMVQEAWLRWHSRTVEVDSPRAFLITVVTRLCLNDLDSARARHEEARSDRLPEPVAFDHDGLERIERLEHVSMAFLVTLQRLSPPERAVVLLHDVFDFTHDEIAPLVGRSAMASRKLLERARTELAAARPMIAAAREEHERLLHAFVNAATNGDLDTLVGMLASDATLVTDGGRTGRTFGKQRNLPRPLSGAQPIATFVLNTARNQGLTVTPRELNGQPALVFSQHERVVGALLLGVANGKIHRVYFHADEDRLTRVSAGNEKVSK